MPLVSAHRRTPRWDQPEVSPKRDVAARSAGQDSGFTPDHQEVQRSSRKWKHCRCLRQNVSVTMCTKAGWGQCLRKIRWHHHRCWRQAVLCQKVSFHPSFMALKRMTSKLFFAMQLQLLITTKIVVSIRSQRPSSNRGVAKCTAEFLNIVARACTVEFREVAAFVQVGSDVDASTQHQLRGQILLEMRFVYMGIGSAVNVGV